MNTLGKWGIKIKLSKCHFTKPQIQFLGLLVSTDSIGKSPEYIKVIAEKKFQLPHKKCENSLD